MASQRPFIYPQEWNRQQNALNSHSTLTSEEDNRESIDNRFGPEFWGYGHCTHRTYSFTEASPSPNDTIDWNGGENSENAVDNTDRFSDLRRSCLNSIQSESSHPMSGPDLYGPGLSATLFATNSTRWLGVSRRDPRLSLDKYRHHLIRLAQVAGYHRRLEMNHQPFTAISVDDISPARPGLSAGLYQPTTTCTGGRNSRKRQRTPSPSPSPERKVKKRRRPNNNNVCRRLSWTFLPGSSTGRNADAPQDVETEVHPVQRSVSDTAMLVRESPTLTDALSSSDWPQ